MKYQADSEDGRRRIFLFLLLLLAIVVGSVFAGMFFLQRKEIPEETSEETAEEFTKEIVIETGRNRGALCIAH